MPLNANTLRFNDVAAAYKQLLGRDISPEEAYFWIDEAANNNWGGFSNPLEELNRRIMQSEEYKLRGSPSPVVIPPPTDVGGGNPAPGGGIPPVTTPGTTPSTNPFQFLPNNFNLPMYEGPYAAPITQGMFDAQQGFKNVLGSSPVMQTQDITNALKRAAGGDKIFDPANGGDINKVIGDYRQDNEFTQGLSDVVGRGTELAESAGRQPAWMGALNKAFTTSLNAPRFDNTQIFKDMETLFEDDLSQQTAELQEQFSGLGLGVGSSDRLNAIASNAGNARARFRVGMGDIARESFENAENRRLGAVSQGGMMNDISQTGFRNELLANDALLGAIAQGLNLDSEAFNRFFATEEGAADRRMDAIPLMLQARGMDINNSLANFDLESAMRSLSDQEIMRQMAEFQRTQGGALEQYLDIIGSAPPQSVGIGPSELAQWGSIIGSLGPLIPGLIDLLTGD